MIVLFEKIIDGLAIWFGCGLSPKAPGTVGTLGAIPLLYLLSPLPVYYYMAATLVFVVITMVVAHFYETDGAHDSPEFVMDEVAGFLVTMAWVPFTWTGVLAGFALFRLLDIWKPFPISYIDKNMPGGVGTVADDLLAGIIANIALQLAMQYGVRLNGIAL